MPDSQNEEFPHTRMRVVKMAIENCIMAKKEVRRIKPDWDHQDQMRRSSRSVYSNASGAEPVELILDHLRRGARVGVQGTRQGSDGKDCGDTDDWTKAPHDRPPPES